MYIREGYVYFAQGTLSGLVKIGWAIDPELRVKEFQTGCPETIELLIAIPGGRDLEAAYHKVFAFARMRGEWFWPHPMLMGSIERSGIEYSAPPDVLRRRLRKASFDDSADQPALAGGASGQGPGSGRPAGRDELHGEGTGAGVGNTDATPIDRYVRARAGGQA